ncbi:hypothetical protein SO694_000372123 [Aureococcus anophagefferens]|uniref:Uncharacterized protein n=1 Tax=Aureococcus anophagefferens TaxID=44056 RepID=A0ABR1FL22_AURAN
MRDAPRSAGEADSALRVAEDDDARSVGDVVAAAARIGEADGVAAAVVAALETQGLASQMTLAALEPRARKRAAQLLAGCAFAKRPSPPPRPPAPLFAAKVADAPPTERAVDDAPACCLLPVRRP